MATLKPQINGPLYCNTVIGTLAVNGWAVTFGTARRGLGSLGPRPFSSNSPPFNGQCTNQLHIIWCGTMHLDSKGLNRPTVCHRFHQQKNKHNRRDKTLHHRLSLGYIRRCLLPPQVFFTNREAQNTISKWKPRIAIFRVVSLALQMETARQVFSLYWNTWNFNLQIVDWFAVWMHANTTSLCDDTSNRRSLL